MGEIIKTKEYKKAEKQDIKMEERKRKNLEKEEGKKKKRATLLQLNQKVEKVLELMNFNPAVKREEQQMNKRVTLGEVNQKLDYIIQMTGLKIEKADKVLDIMSLYFYEFFKERKSKKVDKSSQT